MATISLAILAIISIIITGGDCTDAAMATFNQFPYMASLRKIENHDEPTVSEHFCGGAIISDRWVSKTISIFLNRSESNHFIYRC